MQELVKNRKAFHHYAIEESIEAGISLTGTEVKACRAHNINLADGYAQVENGEVFLINVHISPYDQATARENHEPMRRRRLLLHKAEVRKLFQATRQKGATLIPLSFYIRNHRVKVQLGICRGKREYDKRQTMRDQENQKRLRQVMRREL